MVCKRGVVVFGNPVVDAYAFVDDEFLIKNGLPKGHMHQQPDCLN